MNKSMYVIYEQWLDLQFLCGARTSEAQALHIINTIYTSRAINLSRSDAKKCKMILRLLRHRLRNWAKASLPWIPSA